MDNHKHKVWMRLGGFVSGTPEEIQAIMNGDMDALCNAIANNGFELNGESYIPENEQEFEFGGDLLVATPLFMEKC